LAENSAAAEKPSFAFRLRTGKRGRAKIPSPQPPSFLPARAQIFFKIQRPDFRGKKFGFRSAFGAILRQGYGMARLEEKSILPYKIK
jgi:hypothetical protein